MTDKSSALVPVESAPLATTVEYLSPVMDLEMAKRRLAEFQEFVKSYLVDGEDYGIIPGTKRPTLLKPGADKLCEIYGLAPTFPAERQKAVADWSKQPLFFKYTSTCVLTHKRTQTVVGEGMGSCNSYESKYKYRWRNNERVINTDIADQDNTILKMAQKRALVQAVITVTRSSGIFTQDTEDVKVEDGSAAPPKAKRGRSKAQAQAQPPVIDAEPVEPRPDEPKPATGKMEKLEGWLKFISESTNVADVEKRWAGAMEAAKSVQDTDAMAALGKARMDRRKELRQQANRPADPSAYGEPNVFNENSR